MLSPDERASLPLIFVKVEPKTKADELALRNTLEDLAGVDSHLSFTIDPESGETIIHGVSEHHIDDVVGKLISRGIGVNVGSLKVAYRETLARSAEVNYTHKRRAHGTGEFARVTLRLEPNKTDKGNEFVVEFISKRLPDEYISGIEKGVRSVWENGVLIGFPMVDMKVILFDGACDEVDSSVTAFEIASRAAMKEGCDKGRVRIVEPVMTVEVVTPGDFFGDIIRDLNSKSGHVLTTELRDNTIAIRAKVALANLFGYVSRLENLSQGRASHQMAFSHYQDVPQNDSSDPGTFPPAIGMRA